MRRFLLALCVALGCGGGSDIHESHYVDHDMGVLTHGLKVGNAGGCDTSIVKALTLQLVEELNCIQPNTMTNFTAANIQTYNSVQPFLAPKAATALKAAVAAKGSDMTVSSAYRSVAQQYLLNHWWKAGRCGIQAAAVPGLSNHQSGRAVDVPAYLTWRSSLQAKGYKWFGSADDVHFDFPGTRDLGGTSVLAFQRLWNKNNPQKQLEEDGDFGPASAAAMAEAPAEGFPVAGCGNTGTLTGYVYEKGNTAARVGGATVRISGISKTTDAMGAFAFSLLPGAYTVTVTKSGYDTNQTTKMVVKGATVWAPVEINATAELGTLRGRIYVTNPSDASDMSRGISGATVTAGGKSTTTDGAGDFLFTLPPGSYVLNAKKDGYSLASVARQVVAAGTEWGSMGLSPSTGTDTQAPALTLMLPQDGSALDIATFIATGTVLDDAGPVEHVSISLNGQTPLLVPVSDNAFSQEIKLKPGSNTLVFNARDAVGNASTVQSHVKFLAGVSGVVHRFRDEPVRIPNATVELLEDATGGVVASAAADDNGVFELDVTQVPGSFSLSVRAPGFVDYAESLPLSDEARTHVKIGMASMEEPDPRIELSGIEDGATVSEDTLRLEGRVLGMRPVEVRINGSDAELSSDGRFVAWVALKERENPLEIRALDEAGRTISHGITIHRSLQAVRGGCASTPGHVSVVWILLLVAAMSAKVRPCAKGRSLDSASRRSG